MSKFVVTFTPLTEPDGKPPVPMDPRLQQLLARRQHGDGKPASASTAVGEVAVIAKVTDRAAFEALSEVSPGVVIGDPAADGTTIVTARVPVARLHHVRRQHFVVSLKAAQRLTPTLAHTVPEIEARPDDLPAWISGGDGVVVGIVDNGCDFAHQNFRDDQGATRLLRLWNQEGGGAGAPGFGYGDVHGPEAINAALATDDPYAALRYQVKPRAHGTHVMDIAAGNGLGTGTSSPAPRASLAFVDVANSDIPWTGSAVVGKSFGDSVQLLEAVAFIFETAGTAPCVVNISLGTHGGPHDGTTLVEQGIDRLLTQAPNRAVCQSAGNSFAQGIHAGATVHGTDPYDLVWWKMPGDQTDNELEIWYPGERGLTMELLSPNGQSQFTVVPGQSGSGTVNGEIVLFAANRTADPNNRDNTIGVFLHSVVPAGRWVIRLRSADGTDVPFHAWVERDDGGPSTFEDTSDSSHTIGSISCGQGAIVVGSYNAHETTRPPSAFSSAGPTRNDRHKPDVSAPGHDIRAAASRTGTGTLVRSGTSMAAPAVTGCVALLLGAAAVRNMSLSAGQIHDIVCRSARRDPPAGAEWDSRYGLGRVSAASMLAAL